jgi:hypothetical protein
LQVNLFKNPLQEVAWLFTRVTGQESNWKNCGELISIEISYQLSQYKKIRNSLWPLIWWTVNLIQLPSGTKYYGDKKILCISMKFSMILSQFLKDCYLENIPP